MLTMHPQDGVEKYLCDRAFETKTPISGTFELLPICNMNCKMCYVRLSKEEMNRQGKMLSAETWLDIGRQAAESGTMFLLLTGGEPLLYPEFDKVYEGLRNLGICVTINTNGTLITKEVAELLRRNRPRRVNISLYGSNNEVYTDLCGNQRGFTQTMEGIKRLLDVDVPVKLNYTLTPQNRDEMGEIMRISDEIGIPISVPTYMFPPARKKGIADTGNAINRLSATEAAQAQLEILQRNFSQDDDYKEGLQSVLNHIQELEEKGKQQIPVPGGFLCSAGVSSFLGKLERGFDSLWDASKTIA